MDRSRTMEKPRSSTREAPATKGMKVSMKVKTRIKAGRIGANHNKALAR